MRLIGIDPGSQITGFGIIEVNGSSCLHISSGCLRLSQQSQPERLKAILDGLREVIDKYQPQAMAVEQVFVARNASSALKLGQARGAALCAGAIAQLPISEYTPTQVKQAIVGRGRAGKNQIQHMVKVLLNLNANLQPDAADALAVALCHAHMNSTQAAIQRSIQK